MLVRFVGILEWVGETLICKTPAVPLILRPTQASCLVCLPPSQTHVFNMSLCHFLSFIKLFMYVSSLLKLLTYKPFGSPTTASPLYTSVCSSVRHTHALSQTPKHLRFERVSLTSPVKRFLASSHW